MNATIAANKKEAVMELILKLQEQMAEADEEIQEKGVCEIEE